LRSHPLFRAIHRITLHFPIAAAKWSGVRENLEKLKQKQDPPNSLLSPLVNKELEQHGYLQGTLHNAMEFFDFEINTITILDIYLIAGIDKKRQTTVKC
jgi:hypothetical protein